MITSVSTNIYTTVVWTCYGIAATFVFSWTRSSWTPFTFSIQDIFLDCAGMSCKLCDTIRLQKLNCTLIFASSTVSSWAQSGSTRCTPSISPDDITGWACDLSTFSINWPLVVWTFIVEWIWSTCINVILSWAKSRWTNFTPSILQHDFID